MDTRSHREGSTPWSRSTVAHTTPAAAGVESPTKYRRSVTPVYTLNRASRSAPHTTNRNAPNHAGRPTGEERREEAAEEVAGRQEARQQVDALAPPFTELVPPAAPGSLAVAPHHFNIPMTVTPAVTRSPTRTVTRVPRGIRQSVREPKRIMPKRAPATSLSPAPTRHTMRRATTPAICTTVTRARSPRRGSGQRSLTSGEAPRCAP